MKKKKRILFGSVDIGYRIETYTKYINKHLTDKIEAESFSKYVLPESHYKTQYTYTCPIDKTNPAFLYLYCLCFFIYALFRYDIFHFFSGETILTRKFRRFEFWTYKLFNKTIIMHFVGSDIKDPDYLRWKTKNIHSFLDGKDDFPKSTEWQKKLITDTERYANHILVSTPDLKELIPGAVYYPIMLDLDKFLMELKQTAHKKERSDKIIILHAPSNIGLKGTVHIHNTLKKIAAKNNNIQLLLPAEKMMENPKIYSVSRYELFNLYSQCDIVIDQMIIGWYGLQSVEALAAGKKVICYIDSDLKPFLYPDCPILIADVNSLEQVVEECIANHYPVNNTSNKQMDWVKKHHTIENNNAALLNAWGVN